MAPDFSVLLMVSLFFSVFTRRSVPRFFLVLQIQEIKTSYQLSFASYKHTFSSGYFNCETKSPKMIDLNNLSIFANHKCIIKYNNKFKIESFQVSNITNSNNFYNNKTRTK